MMLSELIAELQAAQASHGDVPVAVCHLDSEGFTGYHLASYTSKTQLWAKGVRCTDYASFIGPPQPMLVINH